MKLSEKQIEAIKKGKAAATASDKLIDYIEEFSCKTLDN